MYDRLEQVIMSRSISRVYPPTADDTRAKRWHARLTEVSLFSAGGLVSTKIYALLRSRACDRRRDSISRAATRILQRRPFNESRLLRGCVSHSVDKTPIIITI